MVLCCPQHHPDSEFISCTSPGSVAAPPAASLLSSSTKDGGKRSNYWDTKDAVRQQNQARAKCATASVVCKKSIKVKLYKTVKQIRKDMRTKKSKFRQTIKTLTALCRWKKQKGDKSMSTKKGELKTRWKKTKDRNSPHVSPANSEAKDDEDVDMNDKNADVNDASNVEDEFLKDKSDEESADEEVII